MHKKLKICRSPINPHEPLDKDDFIIDINEQIKYLKDHNLTITSEKNIISLIENYGFHKLFRAYSHPFVTIDYDQKIEAKFISGTNENSIYYLYNFDNKLKGVLTLLLNSFESKLNANVESQINFLYPDLKKQFKEVWKGDKKIVKTIEQKYDEGSLYLKPFVDQKVYPAWIILDTLMLAQKCFLMNSLAKKPYNTNAIIIKNFAVGKILNYKEFHDIVFDIIRSFRNLTAHGERLMKFKIDFSKNVKMKVILAKFLKLLNDNFNDNLLETFIKDFDYQINSFHVMMMLVYFLKDEMQGNATETLIATLQQLTVEAKSQLNNFFPTNILEDQQFYSWPQNWEKILEKITQKDRNN